MITGIGTPNSQSKIPRPITASLNSDDSRTRAGVRSSNAGCVKRGRPRDLSYPRIVLPVSGVRHRRPRLRRRLGVALLQKLDRMQIGRAHERHLSVARRTVDGDAVLHQMRAGRVDIVDLIGEVTE